jgi:hypothetical protein
MSAGATAPSSRTGRLHGGHTIERSAPESVGRVTVARWTFEETEGATLDDGDPPRPRGRAEPLRLTAHKPEPYRDDDRDDTRPPIDSVTEDACVLLPTAG